MITLRRYWLAILFTAAGFMAAGAFYRRLPERIPVHFDWQGIVDGWMPKQEGAFAIPLLGVVLVLLFIALAPRAAREPGAGSLWRVYPQIVAAIAAFLLYQTFTLLIFAAGAPVDVPASASIGIGLLLVLLGNSFGKTTRNSVMGIRTPWTLASDEVWFRTHRVGGPLFALSGLAMMTAGFLGWGPRFGVIAVLAAGGVSVLYSYVIWRRLHGPGRNP
jgi:uncharacterized membrane protein